MKPVVKFIFLLIGISCYQLANAQHGLIKLKNRVLVTGNNIDSFNYHTLQAKKSIPGPTVFCIIQLEKTLSFQQKELLDAAGITLIDYIPDNAYTASIRKNVEPSTLLNLGIFSIISMQPHDKLSKSLQQNIFPAWAVKQPNTIDVLVHFYKGTSLADIKTTLSLRHFEVTDESWNQYGFITLRIPQQKINELAAFDFVEYIEPVAPDPATFNYAMRANTRANVLNAPTASGGENLSGKGVTIGIGDDGDPSGHVDLKDRVINRAAGFRQTHATHVAGIAAGAGLKDPLFSGVAPKAIILSQLFNGIFLNAATYITDHHMMITNNSWGNITGECELSGVYDTYSKLMDDICIQYPYLLNVFAAGNDGPFSCLGYPAQYHTIVSGHQTAKNVLTVGWSEKNQTVSVSGSIGPTADGRLKPEITSQGSGLRSTAPGDEYFTDWGTSMAAPTVSGGAALLIERYRQLHSGSDPKSGLLKALLMNGARDIENNAPDFKSGYGFLHLARSVSMLNNHQYFSSSVNQGNINTHFIQVPAGTAQLKVMIYWHDPAAAIFAQNTLVNDLDMELVTPGSAVLLPWTLNASSNQVVSAAVQAADHTNNSEQITLCNPAAGNYTIRINGSAIHSGSNQEYFIVYDLVPNGINLTYPSVGEPLVPGETVVINWDAWGQPQNDFTLEFSADNGLNWNTVSNSIPFNARQFNWVVPSISTSAARMRIKRNGTSQADESRSFVILAQPVVSLNTIQCEDYIHINWTAVTGATDYEVMMKKDDEMVTVDSTPGTNYIFKGLQADSAYWVTVRPRINGAAGRRAVAISRVPNNGNCTGNISDNDLKLQAFISPVSGRKFTSTEITANTLIIRIKNLDDSPVTGFTLQYAVNSGSFITQNISSTIPANGNYDHIFTGLDFSAAGNYTITAVVKNQTNDANTANDTLRTVIKQLPNTPVTLPYTENFDAAAAFEITNDTMGLPGLDKWDFINDNKQGRLRSFVNTGIARSGNRSLTLDAVTYTPGGSSVFLIGSFNLSNYTAIPLSDLGLMLEFSYKHHGITPHPDNRVWVRGKDTDQWIPVYNFDSAAPIPGEWKTVALHLSKILSTTPGTSLQVRFGTHAFFSMGDNISNDGITIDDMVLTTAPYDAALISIDTPFMHSCHLSSEVPLKLKYVSYRSAGSCIPIKYQLDGGPVITECAPSTSASFTFANKMNVSAPGLHTLNVWLEDASDTYKKNDSILNFHIRNNPVITTFPYHEDFENDNGKLYTEGMNSSWQWGTPASLKINNAASGTKVWKTTLQGQYNEKELSYLYTPCFDIASLTNPFLCFKMALDMEDCATFICDKTWLEYSTDGNNWSRLGKSGDGINWYNNAENVWDTANFTQWHLAGIDLPAGLNIIQFRFVLQSDAGITREGIAIDDLQIYNRQTNTDAGWRIFPNPVSAVLIIESLHQAGSNVRVQLFDVTGRQLLTEFFRGSGLLERNPLNLKKIPPGMYALNITDNNTSKTFKIVKQ